MNGCKSHPQNTPTEHQFGLGWESETAPVFVGDNYLNPNDDGSIFPPLDLQSSEDPNSEGDDDGQNRRPQVVYDQIGRCWRVWFEILRVAVLRVPSRVCNTAVCVGRFWLIASVTGVIAAVLLSFLYLRVRQWHLNIH